MGVVRVSLSPRSWITDLYMWADVHIKDLHSPTRFWADLQIPPLFLFFCLGQVSDFDILWRMKIVVNSVMTKSVTNSIGWLFTDSSK